MKANSSESERPQSNLKERIKLRLISGAGYWAIRAICSTLRWQIEGWENYEAIRSAGKKIIYVFWHGRIFMATYFWRDRGIVVMTSQNRDGEYIARVILRFGYGAARGSSSRGSRRALVEMIRELRQGRDVAFTIDGPRGPRYVAKPGASYLAWKTGDAVLPFHVVARNCWTLSSWDHFKIPKPFSPVVLLIAPPVYVKSEATEQELDEAQRQIQSALDSLRERGDSRWRQSG